MKRRGVFELVGAAAIGSIVGYYAGAKELLGIQSSTPAPASSKEPETSTEPASDGSGGPRTTNGAFVDEFERERVDPLVAVDGMVDEWAVEDGLDGRSLTGSDVASSVAYDPETYEWSGDRRIAVAFEVNDAYEKQSALVDFYADDVRWQADCGVAASAFVLRKSDAERAPRREDVELSAATEHELVVDITGATVTVTIDGDRVTEYEAASPLGPGTVGFSVRDDTETSFDNVRVEER